MKRNAVRGLVCLLVMLVFLPLAGGYAKSTEANTSEKSRLAILLVTDNAFATLNAEGSVTVQEAITAFVKAAEARNTKIRLQGPTSNAYASALRYLTEDGGSIDWSQMPVRGNRKTFYSTFGRLNPSYAELYSDYDRILVISGSLSDARQDLTALRNINFSVPTWLYQTTELMADHNLLDAYGSVTAAGFEDAGTLRAGFSVYNGRSKNGNDQSDYPVLFKQAEDFSAETMFRDLMRGCLFTDSYKLTDGAFGLAADLVDGAALVIRGESIADIELIGPDGARYQAASSSDSNGNNLPAAVLDWGTEKIGIISLDKIITTG